MTYKTLNDIINSLYPVNDVKTGFSFWVSTLTEKCIGIFEYANLPDSLPMEQIEMRMILNGYSVIFKHKNLDKLVTANGGLSGFDEYYIPTDFIYAQPRLGSGNLKIDVNCAIIYNSTMDKYSNIGLSEIIKRYARQLADIDSSINIVTVNTRATALNYAKNEQVAKSVDKVMKQMQAGFYDTIVDNSIMTNFSNFPFTQKTNSGISELLLARESVLRAFYSEIGVRHAMQKKERLLVQEVSTDNQLLTINQNDMLHNRQIGIDKLNKLFNLNVTVKIAEEYKPTDETWYNDKNEGDEKNDDE